MVRFRRPIALPMVAGYCAGTSNFRNSPGGRVDEYEQRILAALAEDPEGLRRRLSESDREQLDFLLGLYATGGDERQVLGVSRAVAAHLLRALPLLAEEEGQRRLTASALLDNPPHLLLAERYSLAGAPARREPEQGGTGTGPAVGAPDRVPGSALDPAELFREIAERLLAEPSLTAARLRDAFGVDPDDPDLIRLRAEGAEPVLPAFQFDGEGAVLPLVLEINRRLGAGRDPWGVADWWLAPNLWLRGIPAQLLGRGVDAQLRAAAAAVSWED